MGTGKGEKGESGKNFQISYLIFNFKNEELYNFYFDFQN